MTTDGKSSGVALPNRFAEAFDWFFMLRPTLMFPLWTMVLAGRSLVAEPQELSPIRWLYLVVSLSSLFGVVYLLNQMRDREGDRSNRKLLLISTELVSRQQQWVVTFLLLTLSPVCFVLAGFGSEAIWLVAVFGIAGLLYNYTPIALEGSPWGGVLAGASGAWLLLRLGEITAGSYAPIIEEIPYILAFTAGGILTGLPDIAGDRLTGKRTFAVAFGEAWTVRIAGLMIGVAIWIGATFQQWPVVAAGLGGGGLIAAACIKRNSLLAVTGNKAAIGLLAFSISALYPVFLGAIILYYPFARWYHRARFAISYPSFRAE